MSPWVRLDENAIDHPKFLALSDGAWRLWCEGQTYCQKHLTDGKISAAALRRFRYYSPSRVLNLTAVLVAGKSACWDKLENGDITVHDYLDWNDSAAVVEKARADSLLRRRKYRERNASRDAFLAASQDASQTANVACDVKGSSSGSSEVKERGVGKTIPERASAFVEWYEDTHQRLFGIGYMGVEKDWQKILEMCAKFSDQQMRDAALVWFGHDDDFALNGTRTVVKFSSRITGCLQTIRARGIA